MHELLEQIKFIKEIDKLKYIQRKTKLFNSDRCENDAEHSWHMAMVAITLKEYFPKEVNLEKALKMILIHDLVEIYAGDTPAFGPDRVDKLEAEINAAKKLFAILPKDQEKEMLQLWLEFEDCKSNEAIYANVCDKYQGFMQNVTSNGHTWEKFKVPMEKVIDRTKLLKEYLPELYEKHILPELKKYKEKGIIR